MCLAKKGMAIENNADAESQAQHTSGFAETVPILICMSECLVDPLRDANLSRFPHCGSSFVTRSSMIAFRKGESG